MKWKEVIINTALAALWAGVGYLADDPRFLAFVPIIRLAAAWVSAKLGKPIPVDN